ncbi:MAG: DUF2934 domain-containing protein [Pseudoxanthomonas spadix]|nr:MAG: DUF2934 domain-containing protein [Pseudoxanthomonas spadix]
MDEATYRERVAHMAHQIWEAEGRPDGRADRHWIMACRLVDAELRVEHGDAEPPGDHPADGAGERVRS